MLQYIPVTEKWTVLVVNDSSARRTALERTLRREDYGVSLAENGEEGLELAHTSTPDIILLDVSFPDMSGTEVCERLKASDTTAAIPVVFLSAVTDPSVRVAAFRAGAADFIDASCEPAELLVRLDAHRRVVSLQHQLYEQNRRLEAEVERRRRAEDELQRRRQRLQAIIEALPDAVFVIEAADRNNADRNNADRSYVYREVFPAPTWAPRARVGASVRAINADPPGLADALEGMLGAALSTRALSTLDYVQTIDGAERHMEAYGYAINDREVVVIDRDVSARAHAEAALRERERRLRALVEAQPDALAVIDRDGVFTEVYASNSWPSTGRVGDDLSIYDGGPEWAEEFKRVLGWVLENRSVATVPLRVSFGGARYEREARVVALDDDHVLAVVRDVTESAAQERALRESEARNRALLDAIPDNIMIFDRDVRVVEILPPRSFTLLRLPEEIVGRTPEELVEPATARAFRAAHERALVEQSVHCFEEELVLGGLTVYREHHIAPLGDQKTISIVRDVTEQRRAENALKESEARLRAVLDVLPDPIIRHDRAGRYLEVIVPPEFGAIRPAEDLVGRFIHEVLPAEVATEINVRLERVLASGVLQSYHHTLTLPDGVRHREVRMVRLNDNEALSIVRDVTEQRRAENALIESEARLQAILRAVPDSILVLDGEGTYHEVYPSAEWSSVAKPGLNLADIFSPDVVAAMKEAMQRSRREGVVVYGNYAIEIDGERRYHESRGLAADDNTFVSVIRDITDRKQLEIERERLLHVAEQQRDLADKQVAELEALRRDLEQANRLKREFLANMSHELRTPLTAILGFSEVLEMGLGGPLNATQSEYVDNIYSAGKHLLDLINDILDLSKIEAGKMELYAETLDLAQLIKSSLIIVRERAQKAGVRLGDDLEGDLSLRADVRKVKQMLYNYLSNAVKFTPSGGTVTVRAWREGDELLVEVVDTGPGIADEQFEKLFREFSQLENEQTRSSGGTGLGLALVKQLAELHGGRVWVESTLGEGSRFGFALPHAPKSSGAPPEQAEDPSGETVEASAQGSDAEGSDEVRLEPSLAAPPQGTVMFVDDNVADLRFLTDLLARHGYDVRPFNAPREALDAALQQPPDLFVLDVAMPELGGLELARRLRDHSETSDVPILFATVLDDDDTIVSALEVGDDYIAKPFSQAEVLARVKTRLELSGLRRRQAERLREVETLYAQVNEQARALEKLSSQDSLTGLANRRTLSDRLGETVRWASSNDRPLSVIMLDIDHFKRVNDRFSHAVGDEVIKEVARLLVANARDTDLVARYGGEEFTVLLPNTPQDAALATAERMCRTIEDFAWETLQAGLSLTVSLGVAGVWGRDSDAEPPERLLDLADNKLYRAKQQGRNRVVG